MWIVVVNDRRTASIHPPLVFNVLNQLLFDSLSSRLKYKAFLPPLQCTHPKIAQTLFLKL